jgi:hypothetical protein
MDLSLDLSEFPRKCFGHLPTKLESMPNLSKHVGAGVNLYIKRDDCTGKSVLYCTLSFDLRLLTSSTLDPRGDTRPLLL